MPIMTPEEKLRRNEMVRGVLGTNRMEGIECDETTLALFARFEAGDLTDDALSREMDEHARALLASFRMANVA